MNKSNGTLSLYGDAYKKKIQKRLTGSISLQPVGKSRGRVLLSYILEPFLLKPNETLSTRHSNYWECHEIARIFLDRGYEVDVIDAHNRTWLPKKQYDFFIDIDKNLERLAPFLNKDCIKVFHIATSHWKFQNEAEKGRIAAVEKRRGISLTPRRQLEENKSFEIADYLEGLGNNDTFATYPATNKKIISVPGSTVVTFSSPEQKEFDKIRRNFLWLSGGGAVHKGLDLLLECFKDMPNFHLTICGPVEAEKDFTEVYKKELYSLPNIHLEGRIDVTGKRFKDIAANCIAMIYPSCAEGQSGAVITSLHAGLIPIISTHSGVDIRDFGTILKDCSMEEIKKAIIETSALSTEELKKQSIAVWNYAQRTFTKENFTEAYESFAGQIIEERENRPLISVIIPAHDSARTIETAISSIQQQTYKNTEIIVIDDNSSDTTKEVVNRIIKNDPTIFYYKLPFNDPHRVNKKGRNINAGYSARNYGFEKASGSWITFQDADDASLINRIETQLELAKKHGAIHLCLDWQKFDDTLIGTKLDLDKFKTTLPFSTPEELATLAKRTRGLCMYIPALASIIPFEWKTLPIINKLFMRRLDAYPGTGNSPLFKRLVLEKVSFRPLSSRIWPSFTGRGADRDFNFQVALTYKKSFVFYLPLYLWRVSNQNPRYSQIQTRIKK